MQSLPTEHFAVLETWHSQGMIGFQRDFALFAQLVNVLAGLVGDKQGIRFKDMFPTIAEHYDIGEEERQENVQLEFELLTGGR